MKLKVDISVDNILKWIFSILLILNVNSVFYNLHNINLYISELTCVVVAIIAVKRFAEKEYVSMRALRFIMLYLVLALIFSFVSVSSDSYISYGVKFFIFIPIMILLYTSDEGLGIDIIKKCSDFTYLLAILSLIMYFLYYFIPAFGTITIDWGGVAERSNYIFFFAGQKQEIAGTYIMRNTGIFCEAPMYGFVLIMALSTELFCSDKRNNLKLVILVVTIISTLSVSALAIAIVLIGMRYFLNDSVQNEGNRIIKVVHGKQLKYFIGLFVVIVGIFAIYYLVQFKFNTGLSFTKRFDDYAAGFKTWIQNPLFGAGYDNSEAIIENMAAWRLKYGEVGYSNSWMSILASCGLYGFALYFVSFFGAIRNSIRSKELFVAVQIFILILQMVTTTLAMNLYILNYVSFGLAYRFQMSKKQRGGGTAPQAERAI